MPSEHLKNISIFGCQKNRKWVSVLHKFLINDLHSCVSSLFWGTSCQYSVVVDTSLTFDYSRAINFRANLAIICQFYCHCAVDCIVCSVSGSESWRKSGGCPCCHQTLSFNSFITRRNTVVRWEVIKNCTTTTNLEQKKCGKIKMYPCNVWNWTDSFIFFLSFNLLILMENVHCGPSMMSERTIPLERSIGVWSF